VTDKKNWNDVQIEAGDKARKAIKNADKKKK
jgi:hypothetical protein